MTTPDYQQHEEFRGRSERLAEIRAMGIDPYPPKYLATVSTNVLLDKYQSETVGNSEEAAAGSTPEARVSGRLVLFRSMGKNAFGHIQDSLGRIQVMFNRELTQVEGFRPEGELTAMKFIEKKLDLGDIIGVEGHLFRTQKGELTIFAKRVTLLCKTLLPLPDKHSGLTDKGVRYRKRWLDLITHPDVMKQFRLRSMIVQKVRRIFEENGFLEVETPVLQNQYGGAEARPFTTTLNALHQEMYLRIAIELSLKKLIVGGMDRIFEIGKIFRNEGIDRTHNPEFTMLEAYATNWDYNDMMVLVENLFEKIALDLFGTTQLKLTDKEGVEHTIEMKAPWKRVSMKDAVKMYGRVDVDALSIHDQRTLLLGRGTLDPKEVNHATKGKLLSMLFEELAEPHLIQPHHIIDHPIETTPLCKPHRDPKLRAEGFVERFETFILACEMCNSYTELNDPELQRQLLVGQSETRSENSHPVDEEFIEAICQGMPPTGGLGIGIDRLVMMLTGAISIRDVLFFPLMKPEE
jgi:lysyl-tRNA synthetase class 2